jgi:hypothetical protein
LILAALAGNATALKPAAASIVDRNFVFLVLDTES